MDYPQVPCLLGWTNPLTKWDEPPRSVFLRAYVFFKKIKTRNSQDFKSQHLRRSNSAPLLKKRSRARTWDVVASGWWPWCWKRCSRWALYIYIYIHIHTYTYTWTCVYLHTYTYIYTYMYIHMYMCIHVVRVYILLFIFYAFINTYTCIVHVCFCIYIYICV